jgi:predicted CXXCH cytochrome family protein
MTYERDRAAAKRRRTSQSANARAEAGRHPRLGPLVLVGAALALVVALVASAQAETLGSGSLTGASAPAPPIRTHSNADGGGAAVPFSLPCDSCHFVHGAAGANLLPKDASALCATCHDAGAVHVDPLTQQAVSASSSPGDCISCHPHSSGFMPIFSPEPLTLSKQAAGYDDLDADGQLSPGDRVRYRIDYANPGSVGVTGVTLRDELDMTHVASVAAVTDGGTFEGTTIQWSIGTLAARASGFVTYEVLVGNAGLFAGDVPTLVDGSVNVVNTAALAADGRRPVTASVVVPVLVVGVTPVSTSTSTTTLPPMSLTTESTTPVATTTTSPNTTVTESPTPVATTMIFAPVPSGGGPG